MPALPRNQFINYNTPRVEVLWIGQGTHTHTAKWDRTVAFEPANTHLHIDLVVWRQRARLVVCMAAVDQCVTGQLPCALLLDQGIGHPVGSGAMPARFHLLLVDGIKWTNCLV